MLFEPKDFREEEPNFILAWEEQTSEIHVQLMGDVQIEILQPDDKGTFWCAGRNFGEGIVYKRQSQHR